jgi:uncharacterized protein YbjT (DUF2867 family)
MCVSAAMTDPVHVIGASGRSGLALCRSLLDDGIRVVPVVRSAAKWLASGLAGEARQADLRTPDALRAALDGATRIVSCAHARHTPAIIAADRRRRRWSCSAAPANSPTGLMPTATACWRGKRRCWVPGGPA